MSISNSTEYFLKIASHYEKISKMFVSFANNKDINSCNVNGETILHLLCKESNIFEIMENIGLNKEIKDKNGNRASDILLLNNDLQFAKYLNKYEFEKSCKILEYACMNNCSFNIIQNLLKKHMYEYDNIVNAYILVNMEIDEDEIMKIANLLLNNNKISLYNISPYEDMDSIVEFAYDKKKYKLAKLFMKEIMNFDQVIKRDTFFDYNYIKFVLDILYEDKKFNLDEACATMLMYLCLESNNEKLAEYLIDHKVIIVWEHIPTKNTFLLNKINSIK